MNHFSKSCILTLAFLASSLARAGGSAPPADVFAGDYTLASGDFLLMINPNEGKVVSVDCPPRLEVAAYASGDLDRDEDGRADADILRFRNAPLLSAPFQRLNHGRRWDGFDFRGAYTTKKGVFFEEGFESEHCTPATRPGEAPRCTRLPLVTYRYDFKKTKRGLIGLSSSESRKAVCLYSRVR
jgi:hypothetical protein